MSTYKKFASFLNNYETVADKYSVVFIRLLIGTKISPQLHGAGGYHREANFKIQNAISEDVPI